jgi:WD40 repeat protein/predicted Ser/Thr protein kinase/predicted Zn-dependent protease
MSDDLGKRVQDLFDQAIELPAEERAAFLKAACAGYDALRAEVESLLACDASLTDAGGGLLKSPLVRSPDPRTPTAGGPRSATSSAGLLERVGHYRILRRIAEGGMGAVYEAEQENPLRTVALKVIRPDLASPALVKRFGQEVQFLARLQHPGIAQVYEAGLTADGQPFFAMELIRGVPLDEFAHRQNLDGPARLELLARVCDAVQHAHERGIIHRDLKPRNILVDETGQPKVLDFGVARATDAERQATLTRTLGGQLVGTPAYMSPEQVSADPSALDQRTDVYALGVILFELLSGRPPYDLAGLPLFEVAQLIREQEPLRLGAIDSRCRGDVETIAARALAKDKGGRYASAGELAADLRRHLAHQPILARPPSALYQLRKFARRHRALVSAVAGVLAALVAGAAIAVAYALREREQRQIAVMKTGEATHAQEVAKQKAIDEQNARAEAEQMARDEKAARAEAERKTEDEKRARGQAERHRQAARQNLYVANVRLARQAWEEGRLEQMRQLLSEAAAGLAGDEDLRGFEWHYLWRLTRPVEQVLRVPTLGVRAVAFSPDGRQLATAGQGGVIRLWDTATGQGPRPLTGPDLYIYGLAYSPDGRQLASAGRTNTGGVVRVWDAASGRELKALPVQSQAARGVVFSPDVRRLAVACWNSPAEGPGGAKGPFGGRLWLFPLTDGGTVVTTPVLNVPLDGIASNPDGSRLAAAGPEDRKVRIWDAATAREVLTFPGQVVTFSPDGRYLASALEDVVSIREADTGKEVRALKGHAAPVRGLAYSRDGKRLASCGDDETVRVWEADTGRMLDTFKGHTRPVLGLAFSPDGRIVASASDDQTIRVWRVGTGHDAREVVRPGGLTRLALSRDGLRLATGGPKEEVRIWDAASGAPLVTVPNAAPGARGGPIVGLAFNRDGRRLAGATDHFVYVWDAATGQAIGTPQEVPPGTSALAYSPDGRLLAVARQGGVELRDAEAMRWLRWLSIPAMHPTTFAFRPDGRRLAATGLGEIVGQAEVATGQQLSALFQWHQIQVRASVAYSPDGRRLASAGQDGDVLSWDADAEVNRHLIHYEGHNGYVNCLAYSPDGRRLVTGGEDRTVRVWDAATGKELLTLRLPGAVHGLVFSPLGDALFAHDADAVWVWETGPPHDTAGPARWLRLAIAHASTGEWGKAREQLDRATALAPADPAVALARSWVEARAGRAAEARALLEKVVQVTRLRSLDADKGWAGRTLPAPLAAEQRLAAQDTLDVAEQTERVRPHEAAEAADFWRACAWARCALRDWSAAVADFDAALVRDPKDWAARQARARVRAEEDRWNETEADCTACIEAHAGNWECWYLRAFTRAMQHRMADAVADLTEALSHGGDGLDVLNWRARLGFALSRWDLIVADATEVLNKQPGDSMMLFVRAEAYEALGRFDEAATDWEALAKKAPDDFRAPLRLARLCLRRKEWDRAADDFASLIQRFPGRHVSVEMSYAEVGVAERASEFYARLLRLRPDDPQVQRNAALFAVRFGRWADAAAAYAALIERQPNADAEVWFEHAALGLLAGDREGQRKTAALMLKRTEEKKDLRPFLVARACTLAPLPAEEVQRAARLAEAELAQNGEAYWSLTQRGALEVRAGRAESAVPLLRQALKAAPDGGASPVIRLWLSLALHAQGKTEEARAELDAASEPLDRYAKELPATDKPGSPAWHAHDWLEAQVLRRETEAAVRGGRRSP